MLQDDIKLLRREIQIMKKVNHDNILKLHEIYEDDQKVYIVMELCVFLSLSHFCDVRVVGVSKVLHLPPARFFSLSLCTHQLFFPANSVDGSELFDRIVDKGYYSEKNAANIVKQILSAVAYLHGIGIAHRDLKVRPLSFWHSTVTPSTHFQLFLRQCQPENLLCSGADENEIVKIADFGLSKIFSDEEELMTSCGTPGYVAPEVLMCESYDKSVDMWGIGIITYILLAGYPPFYAENDTALFEKIMNAEYDFDDECWDDVSEQAKDFIRHLLVKDPKERYTAEQAMAHPWLTSDASDKQLKISRKMSEYNIKRKEEKAKFNQQKEDSIAALNKARSTVKGK
jgi:calcium/calmodulin-dependent protein kinase I